MKYYPDVYVPSSIKKIRKLTQQMKAAKPEALTVKRPKAFSIEIPKKSNKWGLLFAGGLISSLVLYLEITYGFWLIGGIVVIVALLINRQRVQYRKMLEAFREKQSDNQDQVDAYEKAEVKWRREEQYYKQLELQRNQAFQNGKKRIHKPDGYCSEAPEGASEKLLVQSIRQHLDGQVVLRTELKIPNTDYSYSPDICFIAKGIYFDIEIDEPYAFKTKKPTHGYDLKKEQSRDSFFVRNGWVVIRFSEEQICLNTISCTKFVAEVVNKILGVPLPETLKTVPSLEKTQRWSQKESKELAKKEYRNNYLRDLFRT